MDAKAGFLLGAAFMLIVMVKYINAGTYGVTAIRICEKELPRTMKCRIFAEPIPTEQKK